MGLVLLVSCRGERHPLQAQAQCKSPEVIGCLQEFAYNDMSNADIERLIVQGIDKCFSKDRKERHAQADTCLPLQVGTDRDDHPVELVFRCEDNCTTTGQIWLKYADRPRLEECCERGGLTIRAWSANGHYSGCGVPTYFDVFKDDPNLESSSLCKGDD